MTSPGSLPRFQLGVATTLRHITIRCVTVYVRQSLLNKPNSCSSSHSVRRPPTFTSEIFFYFSRTLALSSRAPRTQASRSFLFGPLCRPNTGRKTSPPTQRLGRTGEKPANTLRTLQRRGRQTVAALRSTPPAFQGEKSSPETWRSFVTDSAQPFVNKTAGTRTRAILQLFYISFFISYFYLASDRQFRCVNIGRGNRPIPTVPSVWTCQELLLQQINLWSLFRSRVGKVKHGKDLAQK
ncbi:hypothetical protein RRG08_019126, partial [Elysia crispata]